MVKHSDNHLISITTLKDADQQTAMDTAIYNIRHAALDHLARWRKLFDNQQIIRKIYGDASDSQIELRSGSPTHIFAVRTKDGDSVSYDFNAEKDDLSVVHTSKSGKNSLVVDDLASYSQLGRLLYECHAREIDQRKRKKLSAS